MSTTATTATRVRKARHGMYAAEVWDATAEHWTLLRYCVDEMAAHRVTLVAR